jgi:hypothetical protein
VEPAGGALPNSVGAAKDASDRRYLQGIDTAEIIQAIHARRATNVPARTTVRR